MKSVGKYLLITLLLFLGLACAGVLYLFFVPNSNLFGLTYLSHSTYVNSKEYNIDSLTSVELNSQNYDVRILPSSSNCVSLKIYNNSFGFAMQQNRDVIFIPSIANTSLIFNITEPHGAVTKNNSFIELYLPTNKALNLILTNNSAFTKIESSDVEINNLNYITNSGDFKFAQGSIDGNLSLQLKSATFKILQDVKTNSNNVNLSLTTGQFLASNSILGNISIESNVHGVIIFKECNDITMDVTTAGGRIEATKINNGNIKTSDTNLKISEVSTGIIINLTASGNVDIENLLGLSPNDGNETSTSTILTTDGNISIGKCIPKVMLRSTHGLISVNNAYLTVDAKSVYGNININFAEDALSNSENPSARVAIIINKNGVTTCTGVDRIVLNIDKQGTGVANITFKNVTNKSSFTSDIGAVNIKVSESSSFYLKSKTENGNSRINLLQTPVYNGWTDKFVEAYINCESSDNSIEINTNSGNILLLDEKLS